MEEVKLELYSCKCTVFCIPVAPSSVIVPVVYYFVVVVVVVVAVAVAAF